MKILLTCGPGYEPIDEVRRLTNHSTGALGAQLADMLTDAGYEVFCLRGLGATAALPQRAKIVKAFGTGSELMEQLHRMAGRHRFVAVLHAAALSDYQIESVRDAQGRILRGRKISTQQGEIQLRLKPAPKVIAGLRDWFPSAKIVGWKYELEGSREQALERGWKQIQTNHTDLCVVNGAAYGRGFAVVNAERQFQPFATAQSLAKFLSQWLRA
jgi:phosphopantothenoylcysteine decarboxylase/phosphopantothenate--cysteine ligase